MIYDLIIVGGGPAGMSAALYAARQNLKFVVITKDLGGMTNTIPELKSYLGFYYITGFELIQKFKEHLSHYKIDVKYEEIKKIDKKKNLFEVQTNEKTYSSKAVIVTAGRRFKKLNIPGEEKFQGKGLSDCTACDGPFFKGKTVAVAGGGRSGLFATLFLLELAKKIYLIEREKNLKTEGGLTRFTIPIKKSKNVTIMTGTNILEVQGKEKVESLLIEQKGKKRALPVDGVFVEVGYDPNTDFMKHLVKRNERGEIIIDEECKTNVPGLFAAGDITSLREKQIIVSVGEGAKAALATVIYLEMLGK